MSEPPAILRIRDREHEFPVVVGTEAEKAIDISKLRAQTGMITLDYGFMNTGSCESAITFIDGEAGILRYRGIDIEELVAVPVPSFLETSYLLIYGELPTTDQLDEFRFAIRKHTLLHEDLKRFFDGFPKDAHPMGMLSSAVSALSTFYQDSNDPHDPDQVQLSIIRLMAKLPTIAAYSYKKSIGQPFLYPDNSLDLIENFLNMMFAVPSEPYEVSQTVVVALKQLLILHADHEQNCSTSTVRMVGSSDANLFASIAAGINALWGPLHGGANQAVIEMLEEIHASGDDIDTVVKRAKDQQNPFRLSGFGHRVYKNYDPRARILKEACHRVLAELGRMDDLLDLALRLEEVALERRLLHRAQALPERRLLLGPHLPRDGLPHEHVHRPVRDRPPARLDRALEGDDGEPRRRRSAGRARSTWARPSARTSRSRTAGSSPSLPGADALVVVGDGARRIRRGLLHRGVGALPLEEHAVLGIADRVHRVLVGTDHRAGGGRAVHALQELVVGDPVAGVGVPERLHLRRGRRGLGDRQVAGAGRPRDLRRRGVEELQVLPCRGLLLG